MDETVLPGELTRVVDRKGTPFLGEVLFLAVEQLGERVSPCRERVAVSCGEGSAWKGGGVNAEERFELVSIAHAFEVGGWHDRGDGA